MLFIRTEDNIYEVSINFEPLNGMKIYSVGNGITIKHNQVIQKGKTIDELIDEYVFEGIDEAPILCDNLSELEWWLNYSREQQYTTRNCYCAIWTKNGLKYVAKMNDKGEWELL